MKYLALVLTLICGSAHATNVFYYPVIDQETGLPNVLYFTDEKSDLCPKIMMIARLETDDKKVLNTLCWARDRNTVGNLLILNLANGQITSNHIPYGVSKYAGDAYPALMKRWRDEDEATAKIMNSYEFKKRRGLLSKQEIEAGQAAYEDYERRAREAGAELNAQAKAERDRQSAEYQAQSRLIAAREAEAKKEAEPQTLSIPKELFSTLSLIPVIPRGLFSPQAGN